MFDPVVEFGEELYKKHIARKIYPETRAIIEAHGGTVGLESTPGSGTTVWFTVGLAPHPPAPLPSQRG